jgi:hypothetical protein
MRITELYADKVETTITIKGHPVNIKFVPEAFSIDLIKKLEAPSNAERLDASAEMLILSELEWDMLDGEGNPLPVTKDVLVKMRLGILTPIVAAISESAAPKA